MRTKKFWPAFRKVRKLSIKYAFERARALPIGQANEKCEKNDTLYKYGGVFLSLHTVHDGKSLVLNNCQ